MFLINIICNNYAYSTWIGLRRCELDLNINKNKKKLKDFWFMDDIGHK